MARNPHALPLRYPATFMTRGRVLHRMTDADAIRTACYLLVPVHGYGDTRHVSEIITSVLCRSCWRGPMIDRVSRAYEQWRADARRHESEGR